MKILFYIQRFPGFGGIETVTELIGTYLTKKGYYVYVMSAMSQDRKSEFLTPDKLFTLPDITDLNGASNFAFADKIMDEYHFDVIVFQNSYAPNDELICRLAAKHDTPLYIFEHSTPLYLKKIYRLKRWWHPLDVYRYLRWSRRIFKHNAVLRKKHVDYCTKYVLLSKNFIPEFSKYVGNGIDESKLTYINNPIIYNPLNQKRIDKKENIILCVCQIEDVKQVNLMIKAWEKMHIAGWKFVIVGDGSLKKSLMAYAEKHNILDIEWVSFCDPTPYYERAKILWMTSLFEGWGMVLVEGMQKGCVPVSFKSSSSISDIIDDGTNGFIVKYMCQSQFIKQTRKIINDESLYKSMAVNAIGKVRKFDVDTIGKEWEKLLN